MRLIGRTPELRHLTASIERVRGGHATVTTIEGEPGIGKTKLLTELRSRVTAEGWHVLDCRCDALDVERPFVALIDALDELCEELGPDAPDELTEVNALLRRMTLGSGPPTSEHAKSTPAADSPGGSNHVNSGAHITALIVEGIHEVARTTPILVVFDDTHWIDEASASVLWGIVRRRRTSKVFLVASFRSSDREAVQAMRRGLDSHGAANLVLAALPLIEAEELASELLGDQSPFALPEILAAAAGNPLFITELIRGQFDHLERRNLTVEGPNGADQTPAGPAIPAALRSLVLRRVSELPRVAQTAMVDAALLGTTFDLHELADIRDMSFDELAEALRPATVLRLLVDSDGRTAFQHGVVQTIIAEQDPTAIRRERHRRIADRLAARGANTARIAEHHWLAGPTLGRSGLVWLRRAGQEVQSLSLAASLAWFERALEHAVDDGERFDVQGEIAALLLLIGRVSEAEALCRSLVTESATVDQKIRVHTLLAIVTTMAGRTRAEEALRHVGRMEELLPPRDVRRVGTLGWRASLRMFSGYLDEAELLARRALTIDVDGQREPNLVRAHESLGLILLLRGDIAESQSHTSRALELFDTYNNMFDASMMPHFAHAMALFSTNDAVDIIAVLQDGFDACERAGHGLARLHLEPLMAICHFVRGDLLIARTLAEKTINRDEDWRTGSVALPTATGLCALMELLRNDLPAALALAARALDELLTGGAQAGSADFAVWCIACVREANGEVDAARDLLVGVWELVAKDASLFTIAPDLVRLTYKDRPDFALDVVTRTQTRAVRSGAALDRANAEASRGFLEQNPAALELAAQAWLQLGQRYPATRIREFAADMALAQGDNATFRIQIDRATTVWETMDAIQPLKALYQRHPRHPRHPRDHGDTRNPGDPRTGVRRSIRPSRPTTGPDALSQAERAVVRLVADGLSNKAIAQRLYVSHRTIDTHVSHALAKLGVSSRVQLAKFADYERA